MAFTDLLFLFVFLPLAWLLYTYGPGKKFASPYLFIVSLIFCAWGSLYSLLVLLVVLSITYTATRAMEQSDDYGHRRTLLIMAGVMFGVILLVYRYLPVWLSFLPLYRNGIPGVLRMPAGLSFYLFSCLSCLFDVYNDKAPAPRSFCELGVFAAFFARLNMGPIAHYARDLDQLSSHPQTAAKSQKGVEMFLQGLFMKVMLADSMTLYFTTLGADHSWFAALLTPVVYLVRLYFDFAGYSRMARGLGSLFGFTIPANFDKPFMALSVQDFWRRWHISLTSWFRNYVYIPLGGNRVEHTVWIRNVLIVWLLTGQWHGATLNFLIWGLLEGGLILMEHAFLGEKLRTMPNWVRHVYVMVSQFICFTFFSTSSLMEALVLIGRWFGIGASTFIGSGALFTLWSGLLIWILAIIGSTNLPAAINRFIRRKSGAAWMYVQTTGYIVLFFICLSSLVSASSQTFLYAVF